MTLADPIGTSIIVKDYASGGGTGQFGGGVYPSEHVKHVTESPEQVSHWISQIPQTASPVIS